MNIVKTVINIAAASCIALSAMARTSNPDAINIRVGGPLHQRLQANLQRLNEPKYQPQNVFLTEEQSGNWPGDNEGRTILALTLLGQTLHEEPFYLQGILNLVSSHLNKLGYMGPVYSPVMSEQQVSGNGWMLRGLCEYYAWKKDKTVLPIIKSIVNNLFVRGKGCYAKYPIDPAKRVANVGEASGSIQNTVDGWMLSSDVGCVFIGMDGAIQAYQYVPSKELRVIIDEMVNRFLQMDLVATRVQAHASLSACRGLIRWGDMTGNKSLYKEAAKRFQLYKGQCMTENYANYNWFSRPDTWTETCAVVDSYMLAVQLWQRLHDTSYRDLAELIYYNAICRAQRYNGGFGSDNCPEQSATMLKTLIPEAYWCCTMRGAEGLAYAAKQTFQLSADTLTMPFYSQATLLAGNVHNRLQVDENTNYPFDGKVVVRFISNARGINVLRLPQMPWMKDIKVSINNVVQSVGKSKGTSDGFILINRHFNDSDSVVVTFNLPQRRVPAIQDSSLYRLFNGPLMLGADSVTKELVPIYHLLDKRVWNDDYKLKILFEDSESRTFNNPLLPRAADCYVAKFGDWYYMTGTPCPGSWTMDWVGIWKSRDLINWSGPYFAYFGDSIAQPMWASEIYHRENHYYMLTVCHTWSPGNCLMIQEAENPLGPYHLYAKLPKEGLDPSIFVDTDGKSYMLCSENIAELSDDWKKITSPYIGHRDNKEGTFMLKSQDKYMKFFARIDQYYPMEVQYSASATPYTDDYHPEGVSVVYSGLHCPGHGCITISPDGTETWFASHYTTGGWEDRWLAIDRMNFSKTGKAIPTVRCEKGQLAPNMNNVNADMANNKLFNSTIGNGKEVDLLGEMPIGSVNVLFNKKQKISLELQGSVDRINWKTIDSQIMSDSAVQVSFNVDGNYYRYLRAVPFLSKNKSLQTFSEGTIATLQVYASDYPIVIPQYDKVVSLIPEKQVVRSGEIVDLGSCNLSASQRYDIVHKVATMDKWGASWELYDNGKLVTKERVGNTGVADNRTDMITFGADLGSDKYHHFTLKVTSGNLTLDKVSIVPLKNIYGKH